MLEIRVFASEYSIKRIKTCAMKNFLIPFDFSDVAINALDYAVKFAGKDPSTRLYLVHIADGSIPEQEIKSKFSIIEKEYKEPGAPEIRTIIRSGEFTPAITDIQKELSIDLIIMGTAGVESEDEVSTGTSEFIRDADLPVLVVPENVKHFKLNTIVLTVGKKRIADKSPLNVLLKISRKFNAEVRLLTIQRSKEVYSSEEEEKNENIIEYFLENFYSYHSFPESEDIEQGIMNYVNKNDIDMLAILPRTHLEPEKSSEGKLTRRLTLRTGIPLLVLD